MNQFVTRSLMVALVCVAVCTTGLVAQEMELPKPAAELAKFDNLIGEWEGSGKAAGGQPGQMMPWTATSSVKKVLDGHFILDQTTVDVGPGMPPIVMRTYYGWDRENNRYVAQSLSNGGDFHSRECSWVGDTIVIPTVAWVERGLSVGRETLKCGKDTLTLEIIGGAGTDAMKTEVTGTFTRKKPAIAAKKEDKGERPAGLLEKGVTFMKPAAEEMSKLKKMHGTWKFKGWMIPMPGAPKMPISGVENMVPVLGGHSMLASVIGDPMEGGFAYKAHAYFCWNERLKCFEAFHVSNMGEVSTSQAWFLADDHMVSTAAAKMNGTPTLMRFSLKWLKDGSMKGVGDMIVGGSEPMRGFEGSYTRVVR